MSESVIYENAKKAALRFNENTLKYKNSNLLKQLKNDMEYIKETYDTLSNFSELGISTHLAGEWILDNFYAVQKEAYSLINGLKNVGWANSQQFNTYTRIYALVFEFVKNVDGKITIDNIREFLNGYTQAQYISIEELWALPAMIKIALIQNIKQICEKIMYAEKQKYKVESIIERLILREKPQNKRFDLVFKDTNRMQINLPFIEYMAYRLRELGEKGTEYADVFDNQVFRLGTTVDDVVSKQHLDVAIDQISIGNSILSLKNINSINFAKEFINVSDIDVILSKEKANIYSKMSEETLSQYRDKVCELAKKLEVSEKYICSEIIELCEINKGLKSHCGYYLFSDGLEELYNIIGTKKKCKKEDKNSLNKKLARYLTPIWILTVFTTLIFAWFVTKEVLINKYIAFTICVLITVIPISQIFVYITDKLILKKVKPRVLPGLDFEKEIPNDCTTMVIIPTLISSTDRVKELIKNLEEMYLTNKQENIYFSLLGDCSEADEENSDLDEELLRVGNEEIDKLNNKYKFDIPKFYFLYRKRRYNSSQGKYLGWERKRGMITQFNRFLIYGEKADFYDIKLDREKIGEIKYVVTIDADTQIGINNVAKLVGIMAHPLNHPVMNDNRTAVIKGHGLLQPRVSTSIHCASENLFSTLWAGYGGIDNYTNAVSDVYQDVWGEGIFTGKGIYDVKVFSQVLDSQIPENTVLSHDLLEGSFLRCGLVTNVEFVDGFPSRFNSYVVRQNRWLRGDIQVLRWCKDKITLAGQKVCNPLNKLSRWKILDNLRRGLISTSLFLFAILGVGLLNVNWFFFVRLFFWVYLLPSVLDKVLNIRGAFKRKRTSSYVIGSLEGSVYKSIFELMFLPYIAITNIETFVRTIYRINISKKNMLEWMTAEQAEKVLGKDLKTYTNEMYISSLWGFILVIATLLFSTQISNFIFATIIAVLWAISPFVAWYISKSKEVKNQLNENEIQFVTNVAKDTWGYFNKYLTKENNYLIPDNYQDNREPKVVYRTSSTNIGLSLMAVICAYDMKFIDINTSKEVISNILDTIDKLKKFKGNIYNWYNIKTLEPLNDSISSVDNGNYIGYLYVLRDFCKNVLKDEKLENRVDYNISILDFSIFYNPNKQLFSIEYNARTGEIVNSYYDLLASESRMLSYVAIAKGDVPYKHWYTLSRGLTRRFGINGLLSWTGTSFEYYMPFALMKTYKYSLVDETYAFVMKCQMKYLENRDMPWGISESAFNLYDLEYNYQYKAFGIPWLGLKRGLKEDLVISPYASILMLPKSPKRVVKNMHKLVEAGGYGQYGYYDAIDYTKDRIGQDTHVPVKTFMAHHQGLILLSINNVINNMIMQKRFHNNAEIDAIDILLQEKPQNGIYISDKLNNGIYEDKKIIKNDAKEDFDINTAKNKYRFNVLSNKNYSVAIDKNGYGYSKLDDIYVYRYNRDIVNKGMQIFIKDIKTDEVNNCLENADVDFYLYSSNFSKTFNKLDIQTSIIPLEQGFGEIRNVKIKNNSDEEVSLEVFFYMEPIITKLNNDLSHRAYSNLFLQYEKINDTIIINRRKKELSERNIALASKIIPNKQFNMHVEFETDRYKFIGRNKDINNANMLKGSVPFSNSILPTVEPILCFKVSVKVPKDGFVSIPHIICVHDNKDKCIETINKFNDYENVKDEISLAYNKSIIESKFYKYNVSDIMQYSKIISYILDNKKTYAVIENNVLDLRQQNLWAMSISGDKPVVMIIINRKIETVYIKKILKAYKYIKRKGVDFDLVIYIKSNKEYTEQIYQEIVRYIGFNGLRMDINYGIYVLDGNSVSENVEKTIMNISVLIVECRQYSNVLSTENDNRIDIEQGIETDEKTKEPNMEKNSPNIINYETGDLLYYNEIGGFVCNGKDKGKEYQIILNKGYATPAPWINILANSNFGTMVSENGIVYSWGKNSGLNKISIWKNDQVMNKPSEYIVVSEQEEGKKWSITSYPYQEKEATYSIKYAKGYAIYESDINDIFSTQKVFVPIDDSCKVCICTIRNKIGAKRKISLQYNMELLMGSEVGKKIYNILENNSNDCLMIKNEYANNFNSEIMYMLGITQEAENNDIDRKCKYDISELKNGNGIIKAIKDVTLEPYEVKNIYFITGQDNNIDSIRNNIFKYVDTKYIKEQYDRTIDYWEELTNTIKVNTPVESMNILINEWLIYQTVASRMFARSGYYQSGGAFGFRDQLQDVLSVMLVNPKIARNQIIYHAKHQYIEGDVQHWWHPQNDQGIRSRYSDDMLWLGYVTMEYIKITGDNSILDEVVPYIESNILAEHEKERYEIPVKSNTEESIFLHICRTIDKSITFGNNNLPNIGSGDWSDGLNNVYGQSVWLGFFLYDIITNFLPYVKQRDEQRYVRYTHALELLKKGLEDSWDGKWYKRAIFKNGDVLGSNQNDECKIDVIVQAWANISKFGDEDKRLQALESVDSLLVDRDNKIIKLFAPSFNNTVLEPGYIKAYIPGVRENGGQYTHGAIWSIMAQAINGNGNLAEEYFRMLNPIEHARTNEASRKYKVEPYVVTADVYSSMGLEGRGGWSWYTGSSSWLYKVAVEYILGLQIRANHLNINPCINSKWHEYELWYMYMDTKYHIVVRNPNGKQSGVDQVFLDNNLIPDNIVMMQNDKQEHEIIVIM